MDTHARLSLSTRCLTTILAATIAAAVSTAAHASTTRLLALPDLVAESRVIVVGTVKAIDERAGVALGEGEPITRIDIQVERTLHGTLPGRKLSLRLPVGYVADGSIVHASDTPTLHVGDRYVLFLRAPEELSPIVSASGAILRVVDFGARSIVVSESGHAIRASETHGLVQLGRVAASLAARAVESLRALDSDGQTGVEPASKPIALGDVAYASDAEDVMNMISNIAAEAGKP